MMQTIHPRPSTDRHGTANTILLGQPDRHWVIVRHIAVAPLGREVLGRVYLRRTRGHRRTDRPMFIDKAQANFRHGDLIKAILLNARIVDVRRDAPGAGCRTASSCSRPVSSSRTRWKDIAAYRRGYVRMMPLWDDLLPGAVHRVEMQDLVTDAEPMVRHLPGYFGLPFEPACLDVHRTERAIRTPGTGQVRQPISLGSWRPC